MNKKPKITTVHPTWKRHLPWFRSKYRKEFESVVANFPRPLNPHPSLVYRPWSHPPKDVKVIFVCYRPFTGKGTADGYAMSTLPKSTLTRYRVPMLSTFYKEYSRDLGVPIPKRQSLENWAQRGVMLVNVVPVSSDKKTYRIHHKIEHLTGRLVGETIRKLIRRENKKLVIVYFGSSSYKLTRLWTDNIVSDNVRVVKFNHLFKFAEKHEGYLEFEGSRIFTRIAEFLGENPREFWRV